MARLKPPADKKKKTSALSKASPTDTKLIQFKVSADLHHELKSYALENHISMTDLFKEMYNEYRAKHG